MTVVTLEVKKHAFVRTHAQERANDFYGQHLAVVQRRLRTALTKFQVPSLKPIVNISKHCHDKCVNIYFSGLHFAWVYVKILQAFKGLFLMSNSKLAHGVI